MDIIMNKSAEELHEVSNIVYEFDNFLSIELTENNTEAILSNSDNPFFSRVLSKEDFRKLITELQEIEKLMQWDL